MHPAYPPPVYHRPPAVVIIGAIIPLDEFRGRCGDSRLRFLQQMNIGIEDILTDALRYKLQHIVPVEQIWFEHYADTMALQSIWESMYGNPARFGTFDGFVKNYLEALYLMYIVNFSYFELILRHHGVQDHQHETFKHVELLRFFPHGNDCRVEIRLTETTPTI